MREEGIRKSDDRTISHPHGYWFSGTGYSKFGRKSSAERSGAEAGCWMRPQRSLQSISLSLFLPVCQEISLQRDDDESASVRFVSFQSGWMCFRVVRVCFLQHLLGG